MLSYISVSRFANVDMNFFSCFNMKNLSSRNLSSYFNYTRYTYKVVHFNFAIKISRKGKTSFTKK